MKKYLLILASVFCSFGLSVAQDYYVPNGYVGYYDYDHRVVVRENVACTEDYQDLWNGYYYYTVDGRNYRVADEDGDYIGVWGNDVTLMNNGNFRSSISGNYYMYDTNGNRVY